MKFGGNNFNYFPENQLTKFSAVLLSTSPSFDWPEFHHAETTCPGRDSHVGNRLVTDIYRLQVGSGSLSISSLNISLQCYLFLPDIAQCHNITMTGRQNLFTGRHKCRPVTMLKNTLCNSGCVHYALPVAAC